MKKPFSLFYILILVIMLMVPVGCSRTPAVAQTELTLKDSPFSAMANKKILLRNDDVELGDNVSISLKWLSNLIIDNDIKMTYAVMPGRIQNKPEIINYLQSLLATGHFEMGTHGLMHEEIEKLPYNQQFQLLQTATNLMTQYFGVRPLTFLPPYQSANVDTTRALKALGYHTMASVRSYSAPYVETAFAMNDFDWEVSWSPTVFATYNDFVQAFDDFYLRDKSKSPNDFFVIQSHHGAWLDDYGNYLGSIKDDYAKSIAYMKSKNVEFMTMEQGYEWEQDLPNITVSKRGEDTYFISFRGCQYQHTVKFQAPQGWSNRILVYDINTRQEIHLAGPDIEFDGAPGHQYNVINTGSIARNVNQPPVLASIGDKTCNMGELMTFTVNATDPDGDILRYKASNLPQGATFGTTNNTFSWVPQKAGLYTGIHFEVTDGELSDKQDINIRVYSWPKLDPIGNKQTNEGQPLNFTISGSDPDNVPLTYSATNLPKGAAFDPVSQTFNWTPSAGQLGTYPDIRFSVSFGKLSASENVTIIVYHAGYVMPSVSYKSTLESTSANGTRQIELNFDMAGSENRTGFIDWENSLQGYWPFDEGSGKTAGDVSTYSHNGTLLGNPQWVKSKFGSGLQFDGETGYVSVSDNTSFNFSTGDFTVEFWVKNSVPLQSEDDTYPIAAKVSSGANGVGWSCWLRGGAYNGIYFRFHYPPRYSGAEIIPDVDLTGNVTDDNWHHFAAVRYSGNVTLYFDGKEVGSKICDKDVSSNSTLFIGTFASGSANKLNAALDEFRIWGRALTPKEIEASYDAKANPLVLTLTNPPTGTFKYYAYVKDIYGNNAKTDIRNIDIKSGG